MTTRLLALLLFIIPLGVLFAGLTVIAAGSPRIAVVQEIEDEISAALRAGFAAAEGR